MTNSIEKQVAYVFAGLFITVPYSVSYLALAITAKADLKPPIHAKRPFPYSSPVPNFQLSSKN